MQSDQRNPRFYETTETIGDHSAYPLSVPDGYTDHHYTTSKTAFGGASTSYPGGSRALDAFKEKMMREDLKANYRMQYGAAYNPYLQP